MESKLFTPEQHAGLFFNSCGSQASTWHPWFICLGYRELRSKRGALPHRSPFFRGLVSLKSAPVLLEGTNQQTGEELLGG